MSHGLIGLLRTTFDSSLADETFVSQLICPFATVLEIRVVRCPSYVKCYLQLSCESDAKNVALAFDGKPFAWGTFEFPKWSGELSAEDNETLGLNKLPTDTSVKKKSKSVTQSGNPGVSLEQSQPSDLADLQLISQCFEDDYFSHPLSSPDIHDLRRVSAEEDYFQPSTIPLFAREIASHPNLYCPNQSKLTSRIVTIAIFDTKKLNAKSLANLFGSMGNVNQVVVNDSNSTGFIEFEMETDVQKSIQFLQSLPLFGYHLSIRKAQPEFSLEHHIQFERRPLQVYSVQTSLHRYRNYFGIRVNPPSNILHFTNIDDRADPVILYAVISAVQEPETLYLLRQRSHNSRMFLVKFRSVAHAVEVLAVLHNKQLGSRVLKISFSKMKV